MVSGTDVRHMDSRRSRLGSDAVRFGEYRLGLHRRRDTGHLEILRLNLCLGVIQCEKKGDEGGNHFRREILKVGFASVEVGEENADDKHFRG